MVPNTMKMRRPVVAPGMKKARPPIAEAALRSIEGSVAGTLVEKYWDTE